MVERLAVNEDVVGSIPTSGAVRAILIVRAEENLERMRKVRAHIEGEGADLIPV